MKITVKDLEGKTRKELDKIVYNLIDGRADKNDDNIYRKFVSDYCKKLVKRCNSYVDEYVGIKEKVGVTEKEKKEAEEKYMKGMKEVLTEVIKNIEKYDNLANYIEELKNKISQYEKYKNVDAKNINEEISKFESTKIHPNQIDEIKGKLENLEKVLDKEFEKVNEFVDLEKGVGGTLEKLKNKKFVTKKEYDKYKEKIGDISKIFHSLVYKDDYKADASMKQMKEFENDLSNLLNKSGELKSFGKLEEEELGEDETKQSKVKNYIKTRIGNARYFEAKIISCSDSYNKDDDVMPLEEMREIYGSKGALMMICHLEDGSLGKRKRFSTYRKFCNKILENYRSLKVEAAITALEGGNIGTFVNGDEDKIKKLNSLLHELNELEGLDTSKFPLADSGNKKFSFSKFFSSTKSQIAKLKNTKGAKNAERKKLIDQVVKEIKKIESDPFGNTFDVETSLEKQKYIKKYNDFVNKSAKLAVTYLKSEGEKKIKRFKEAREAKYKEKGQEYYAIDVCKVALMCLVAVCSKKEEYRTKGKKYFSKVKKYLLDTIG